jgi:L-ascorbate metabolism protein UlaG (beta-lactamase superfamily)
LQLTHFGHACVLVDTGSARLLFDPGTFSHDFEGLRDLDGVLITHAHADHLDLDRLQPLLEANSDVRLIADTGSAESLRDNGIAYTVAHPGDVVEIAGAAITVVGGEHAVIHPDLPTIPNIGYLVNHGAFYHPGDSFHVPEQRVDVLGLPTGAPWLKLSEAVDFLRAVSPRAAVPIHQAVLAIPDMHYRMFQRLGPEGTQINILTEGRANTV